MILLQAQHVARRFGANVLFSNVQLEIKDHARIGLVGRNGAGKSTLLKIIAGLNAPDEGTVTMKKDVTLSYLAQNSGLNSNNTIWNEMLNVFADVRALEGQMHSLEQQIANDDPTTAEYVKLLNRYDQLQHDFAANNGYGYEAAIRGILHGFNFPEERYADKINSLSGGQRTRLALAKALLEKPDLLILDEPTNHLDTDTLAWLESYLQNYAGALLVVSHDRYFLDRVITEVYDMNFGHLDHYQGNYSNFLEVKAQNLKTALKEYEKQQKQIEKLEDFVNRNIVRASTTKRSQSRRKQLERMEKIQKPKNDTSQARIQFATDLESGHEVLRVKKATIGYTATHPLSQNINLTIDKHHAVAIVGPNGIGKSTLLKSILQIIPFIAGEFKIGANVSIGYYDQEQQLLHENNSVLHELWNEHPLTSEKDIRSILGSFLFSGDDIIKKVSGLSGGERARLMLTKLAMNHDNFLILDEPTNHLDIDSREVLETAINEFNGTVLFVSHDRYFINQVATEIVEISQSGSTTYMGDYDYYLEKSDLQATQSGDNSLTSPISNNSSIESYQANKNRQKDIRKATRAVEEIEQAIETNENEQLMITNQMNDAANATNIGKLSDLQKDLDNLRKNLEQLNTTWEERSLTLEELQD
ncbi:ATP-binding cassette subfamily F protein 3 [Weissella beninensis]|uniref:ABC-F family ATP-binding cassette domain-containing protein n=1 Tax=Periweissella beninensis TaxID=504936 RepID=A0ABT0VHS3_9LACO|nr:ABC-F family ATP-binding cassette domain-containing protein [Periweissella beninensis]MBM7544633.1 ATP-binding cassette subfamily F protein 3 [Periweissella beninensis]MCM2436924.1 ABC-F family ATP-binding cassette domain-containing protein [Periweissella beninensis]